MIPVSGPIRFLTINNLRQAMRASSTANYNRQLEDRLLEVADPRQTYPAQLLMIHQHRRFKPGEPHARLGIEVALTDGDSTFVVLDVPTHIWKGLSAKEGGAK